MGAKVHSIAKSQTQLKGPSTHMLLFNHSSSKKEFVTEQIAYISSYLGSFLSGEQPDKERKDEKSRCQHLIFPLAK